MEAQRIRRRYDHRFRDVVHDTYDQSDPSNSSAKLYFNDVLAIEGTDTDGPRKVQLPGDIKIKLNFASAGVAA